MDNFTFYAPTYFVFGKEQENSYGQYVKRFGGTKVLIHYGGGSVKRSGLLDRVKASLDAENIPYLEWRFLGLLQQGDCGRKRYGSSGGHSLNHCRGRI